MLRRQQAEAVIAARQKIVQGAVSMVDMALQELAEKQVVTLDDERKAAMVSNLMVVLCGETEVHPVVNTGTAVYVTERLNHEVHEEFLPRMTRIRTNDTNNGMERKGICVIRVHS